MTSEQRTEIQELGEFGLIDRISAQFSNFQQPSTLKGIGDDAAIIDIGNGEVMAISTDMLVENIHFDLSYMPLTHVGFKAVSVNVSDIAAMNAIPQQITVSLGLSNRFSVEAIDALYQGIKAACDFYGIDLIGGDTTSSPSGLLISVTAAGRAKKEDIAYRSGAKKGDILCVTGDLGAAYLGLQVMEREKQVFLSNPEMQPQLQGYEYLMQRQMKPEARTNVIHELREAGVKPTAMIDISDGLASEALHLCKQSDLGVVIYEEKLPIDQKTAEVASEEFKLPIATCALNGGDDYELLMAISQEDFPKIEENPNLLAIGYFTETEKGKKLVTRANQVIDLKAQGWVHF